MYIIETSTISPQETHTGNFIPEKITHYFGNKYTAIEPDYSDLIRPAQLRRMGKSIRMGIGAALPILQVHENIEGIILGSSEGGLEDCIKFLNQIVTYNEGSLTPTNFVQSTPNALAGNLALSSQNTGYNITHVHKGLAFENALLDAFLLFEENKVQQLLIGNVEEISEYNFNIEKLAGQFKEKEIDSTELLISQTKGTVCGEGSSMFLVSNSKEKALAQIIDVAQISYPTRDEIVSTITKLLQRNNLENTDIDSVIIGKNGDSKTDYWYNHICDSLFAHQNMYSFKNLVGEYPTSSAFACYFAAQILSGKKAPKESIIREICKPKIVLIYNHYKGEQHGLILMSV